LEKILVVSSNKNATETLLDFLRGSFKCSPKIVESAYQAKTHLESDLLTELVMINSPLMDESGVEFAEYVTENTTANCILLIKSETAEKISERAEKAGVIKRLPCQSAERRGI
jgi:response regulator NasT